jgi:hypothetical protein
MKILYILIIEIFIVSLFLHSKLLPYKEKLNQSNLKIFNFFDNFFTPLLNFLRQMFKPYQIGIGLSVDMSSILLLIIFLVILAFIA